MSEMAGGEGRAKPEMSAGSAHQQMGHGQGEVTPGAAVGRYLVAPRPPHLRGSTVRPIEPSALFTLLDEDPDVKVIDHVWPNRSRGLGAIAEPNPACPPVAVVRMPHERAAVLAANPQVLVESDQSLTFNAPSPITPTVAGTDPALAVPLKEAAAFTVRVTGQDDDGVSGVHVWATGAGWPAHAVTDAEGRATLVLPTGTPAEVNTLHVSAPGGYWPARIDNPGLPEDGTEAPIQLRPLNETFEGFPERAIYGWGQQVMRLHELPPHYRGHGITIALLDSGVATAHPDLKTAVSTGFDFVTNSGEGWDNDTTGHGTACAGIIAAADNRTGITGIAAEATLHALKLYPGGRISNLLQALDWCITHDVDIAQINLICSKPSALLALKIVDTRAAGIVCIAPAGDDGTTVAFPARLPGILAVGACGHTGTYPPTAPSAAYAPGHPTVTNLYAPPFTPLGPGVDLSGPGVAVITTAPGDTYTPYDGTAIAASHITGLAALTLAHHDALRIQPQPRSSARVDHVHTMLRTSCRPVPGIDPTRIGAGLPDAPAALGLQPTVPTFQSTSVESLLATLRAEMQRSGLVQR
jgi:subtilisin family serine protease